jgi:hypothetical protein
LALLPDWPLAVKDSRVRGVRGVRARQSGAHLRAELADGRQSAGPIPGVSPGPGSAGSRIVRQGNRTDNGGQIQRMSTEYIAIRRPVHRRDLPLLMVTVALIASLLCNLLICFKVAANRRSAAPSVAEQEEVAQALFMWDVRQSKSVLPASDHQIVLSTVDVRITYDFDPRKGTLTRSTGSESCTLLTNIESASFLFCQRPRVEHQAQPAKGANAGLVVLTWKTRNATGPAATRTTAACL